MFSAYARKIRESAFASPLQNSKLKFGDKIEYRLHALSPVVKIEYRFSARSPVVKIEYRFSARNPVVKIEYRFSARSPIAL